MRDFDDPAVWRVECVTVNGWDGLRTELEDYGHDAAAIDRIFREIKANKSSAWFEY